VNYELLEIVFNEAAFKHGISEDDIRMALGSYLVDMELLNDENKYLLVGFDRKGNLIELMYNIIAV
jgi:hypothetical protein